MPDMRRCDFITLLGGSAAGSSGERWEVCQGRLCGCRENSRVHFRRPPRVGGPTYSARYFAISSGDRLKASTSISATKTTPTATETTAAPPRMRAAMMPPVLMAWADPRSRFGPERPCTAASVTTVE
jgi:hypothetical protein